MPDRFLEADVMALEERLCLCMVFLQFVARPGKAKQGRTKRPGLALKPVHGMCSCVAVHW